uniref:Phosphorylated adapter RNA export protein n=1 Tax=Leersia perrieri TaxID=77586 RepID=A0A0D9V216_9ORYZ
MERGPSVLGAVLGEETLDFDGDDVEMADADEAMEEAERAPVAAAAPATGGGGGGGGVGEVEMRGAAGKNKKNKKKKSGRRKNKGRPEGPPKIADINRFVNDTCKRLKEKKSYLVWNAVGCLGFSAVSDLVREVEAIQKCGGQTIADGSRFRTGGGILWNILKSREPKAYKEIMAKGRELEKQFRYTKGRPQTSRNEDASSQGSALIDEDIEAHGEKQLSDDPERLVDAEKSPPLPDNKAERKPLADRIRVPVAYDDLFEEGEIHEVDAQ